MQKERWAATCAFMAAAWHRPIGQLEQQIGFKMVESLPDEAVEGAVRALAESGREMLPPWGVIYRLAQDMRHQFQLALQDPDWTRDLTPEELEHSRSYSARLQKRIADLARRKAS